MLRNLLPYFFFGAIMLISFAPAPAQEPSDPEIQSWNDLQFSFPVSKTVDLFTVTTIQFAKRLTIVDNTRFAVGVNKKLTNSVSLASFVTFLSDRNSSGRFRYEYRYSARAIVKGKFKGLGISHRSQAEYRFRPGRNTWRYRPSITIEKELPEKFVPGTRLFVTEEPFYDSASGRFSRNRISAGVKKKFNEKFSVDLYYLYQGDNFSRSSSTKVIGTSWKIAL